MPRLSDLINPNPLLSRQRVANAMAQQQTPAPPNLVGALTDKPFYTDVGNRLSGLLEAGARDVFPTGARTQRLADILGTQVDPNYLQKMTDVGLAGITVFHGTRNPAAIEGLVGRPGGLKMMDGLGPHVGTAEAANERLAKNAGVSPSKAWNKPLDALNDSYVMPLNFEPVNPFVKKNGTPYSESELQSKLADIAESLGHSRNDTRAYSSAYPATYKMKQAQQAVREHLVSQGYDAIPYINSHEARGSTSYVALNPSDLKFPWAASE